MYAASHRIPEQNVPALQAKFAKLNRRAIKLGLPQISIVIHPLVVAAVKAPADRLIDAETVRYGYHWVSVIGEPPAFAGWTFVARYDWETAVDGTSVCLSNSVPGEVIPADRMTVAAPACEHCGKIRSRKNTFLLRHEDGRYIVVGRTCISDFLGTDLARAMAGFDWLRSIDVAISEESEERFSGGGDRREYFGIATVLAQAAACVRLDGYRNAQDERGSTGSEILYLFRRPHGYDEAQKREWEAARARCAPSAADVAVAGQIASWIAAQGGCSEWIVNLKKVVSLGHCPENRVGLLASAIVGFNRDAVAKVATVAELDEYVGAVGSRDEFNVTVVRTSSFDSQYGGGLRIVMRDQDGRALIWFATGEPSVREGWTGVVKATVKSQAKYQGKCQTVLSRVVGLGDET